MEYNITDNGIEFIDSEKEEKIIEDVYFIYEKSDIPIELIKECDDLSVLLEKTMFIFDSKISNRIFKEKLTETYHIGDDSYFKGLQSRFSYYDTETKLINRYDKCKLVIDFFSLLGFISGGNNFGPEYEQSYFLPNSIDNYIVRIQPNLIINLTYDSKPIYNSFFNKSMIIDIIVKTTSNKSLIRDLKLIKILN